MTKREREREIKVKNPERARQVKWPKQRNKKMTERKRIQRQKKMINLIKRKRKRERYIDKEIERKKTMNN